MIGMQAIFRGSMDFRRELERPRTAMDVITNTHDTLRSRGINKKRRLSGVSSLLLSAIDCVGKK
jgi:hypothetical protein